MRDPAPIESMLTLVREIWEASPDLRLGQLIVNAARPNAPCPEIYSVEDDALASGLRSYQLLVASVRKSEV